ncbi:MAG: DUF4019 domain-containing protein [Pyrinomonadaceae bacterium]
MKLIFAATLVLFLQLSFQAQTIQAQTKIQDSVRLTAVDAPWDIVIEGGGLDIKQVGVKPRGAYFLLYPNKEQLNISFYIEPAEKCKTSDDCRDLVLNAGNPAWGKFENLNKARFGQFSYFEFFRPEAMGQPLKMQDMYAQYVDKGYWVDLHISKVLYKKEDKLLFEKLMNSIKFVPKTQTPQADKNIELIKKVAENWLGLWGDRKCSESYRSLTSISREAVKESQWLEYCSAAHQGVGKLKSRELIAITTTGSLPGKSDRAGAAFRYQSEFDNHSGVEFVSFTQEKDGTWTVSNYLVQ